MGAVQIFGLLFLGGLVMYAVLHILFRTMDRTVNAIDRPSVDASMAAEFSDAQPAITEDVGGAPGKS